MAAVFVSHRSADAQVAERIARALRGAGHTVWLDDWAIDTGDSIVQKVNSGLTGSRYVVLCCSSSGVLSPWLSREWMSALARQLNGADVTLLPVLLERVDPPAILSDIKYADLAADWEEGLAALLRAIR